MDRLWTWAERGQEWLGARLHSFDFLRAGLMAAAIAVASGTFGALLLMSSNGIDQGRYAVDDDIVEARFPRPRPDEPIVTGSIRPSQPGMIEPPEPVHEHAARNRRFDDLQTRAILIASSWAECDDVANSELFELPDNTADQIMVRIHCANGTRFMLGEADIVANRIGARPTIAAIVEQAPAIQAPPATVLPPTLTDAEVLNACEAQVRLGLPFPNSLSRGHASTGISRLSEGNAIVTFNFDALNGFGYPLFMRAECVFQNREIARLELTPR